MNRDEALAKHKEYLFPCVGTYYADPLPMARGQMQHLWDVDGKQYLDFFGGIVTVSVGHAHPHVTEAIQRQAATLVHTSTLYPIPSMITLAEKLASIAPGKLKKSFFTCSGTEADETAILLARLHTGSDEVVALRHGYSGRSALAMNLTGHANWRRGGTVIAGIKHLVNPYCYRCPFGLVPDACGLECARDLESLIQTTTSGSIACILVEPVQGVGGFIVPPKEWFGVIAEITRRYGGLFIADEVQTGFGRTGTKWFGIEHFGVEPDIMTGAKGIANGSPLGLTMATDEVAASFTGLSISTFGGNPVSSEAALATIEVVEQEGLLRNSAEVGNYFQDGLRGLQEKHALIGDVRGMGLAQAIELVTDRKTKEPAAAAVGRLFEETRARGLLIGKGGLLGNVVRMSPPLNIGKADVDEAIRILDESLAAAAG